MTLLLDFDSMTSLLFFVLFFFQVANIFKNHTIENNINVIVKRIHILQSDQVRTATH